MKRRVQVGVLAVSAVTIVFAVGACGSAEGTAGAKGVAGTPPSSTKGNGLTVDEWGVVDVPASGLTEIAAGPGGASHPRHHQSHAPYFGLQPLPRPLKKPVVYFHLASGAAPVDVDVKARIPGGFMMETWPGPPPKADSIEWAHVHVAACDAAILGASSAKTTAPPACVGSRDLYCETPELRGYVTDDAACLTVGGLTAARLLFYRGNLPAAPLPIEVVRHANGQRVMRASVAGEGNVLLVMDGRGITLPWPKVGTNEALPDKFDVSQNGTALGAALTHDLAARGLSKDEIAAFMRAWSVPFFGVASGATNKSGQKEMPAKKMPSPGPSLSLIYLMPEASIAKVAELTITPSPAAVHRAMVVRIDLSRR